MKQLKNPQESCTTIIALTLVWLWAENFYHDQKCTRSTQKSATDVPLSLSTPFSRHKSRLSTFKPGTRHTSGPFQLLHERRKCSPRGAEQHPFQKKSLNTSETACLSTWVHAWVHAENSQFQRFCSKQQQASTRNKDYTKGSNNNHFLQFFCRWLPCAWPSTPKITPRRSTKITTLRCPRFLAMPPPPHLAAFSCMCAFIHHLITMAGFWYFCMTCTCTCTCTWLTGTLNSWQNPGKSLFKQWIWPRGTESMSLFANCRYSDSRYIRS